MYAADAVPLRPELSASWLRAVIHAVDLPAGVTPGRCSANWLVYVAAVPVALSPGRHARSPLLDVVRVDLDSDTVDVADAGGEVLGASAHQACLPSPLSLTQSGSPNASGVAAFDHLDHCHVFVSHTAIIRLFEGLVALPNYGEEVR